MGRGWGGGGGSGELLEAIWEKESDRGSGMGGMVGIGEGGDGLFSQDVEAAAAGGGLGDAKRTQTNHMGGGQQGSVEGGKRKWMKRALSSMFLGKGRGGGGKVERARPDRSVSEGGMFGEGSVVGVGVGAGSLKKAGSLRMLSWLSFDPKKDAPVFSLAMEGGAEQKRREGNDSLATWGGGGGRGRRYHGKAWGQKDRGGRWQNEQGGVV